jgi:hypothetical protein
MSMPLYIFQHHSEEQVRVCQLNHSCLTSGPDIDACNWTLADASRFFYDRKLRMSNLVLGTVRVHSCPRTRSTRTTRHHSRVSRIFHRNIQGDTYISQKDRVTARHRNVHLSKHAGQKPIQTPESHACRRKLAALLAPRWSAVGRQRVQKFNSLQHKS